VAKLGNLASRFVVAAFAVPIILFVVVYLDRPEPTWALVLLATLLAMYEFFAMALEDRTDRLVSLGLGAVTASAMYWLAPGFLLRETGNFALAASGPMIVLVLAVVPAALYYLFRLGDMKTVAPRIAYTITGIVYVGLLLAFLALIKRDFGPSGGYLVIFVLLVTWVGDTGAYFAGRFLGKTRLYEAVSPKKTWAGAVGGLAASAASGAAMKLLCLDQVPWIDIALLSIPGAILGQMGDLVESLFKRSTGVKDSGAILPGHGGLLDRVDAVLFMAPYVYLYLTVRPALFP